MGAWRRRSGGIPAGGIDHTVNEACTGKQVGDELMAIELAPVTLGVLEELVDHRQAGVTAA